MKALILFLFFLIKLSSFSQNTFCGTYNNGKDEITFKEDSTFYHEYRLDLFYGWSQGTWSINPKNNIIILDVIPILDTLYVDGTDTLILSNDIISQRIIHKKIGQVQNVYMPPTKLKIVNGRLFALDNKGKLIKKDVSLFTGKKYSAKYIKQEPKTNTK